VIDVFTYWEIEKPTNRGVLVNSAMKIRLKHRTRRDSAPADVANAWFHRDSTQINPNPPLFTVRSLPFLTTLTDDSQLHLVLVTTRTIVPKGAVGHG
jgi:hypothetical protein